MKQIIYIIAFLLMFVINLKGQNNDNVLDFLKDWEQTTLENVTVPDNIENHEKIKKKFEFYVRNSSQHFIKQNKDSILGKRYRFLKNIKESNYDVNLSNCLILEIINEKKHEFVIVSDESKRFFTFKKDKKWKLKKAKQTNYNELVNMYVSFSPKVDCNIKKENIVLFDSYSYLIMDLSPFFGLF